MANIGFIGLGVMGGQMVDRLMTHGHTVTGYNRTRAKAQWLIDKGMKFSDTPRGVAGRSAWQVQDKVVVLGHCLLLCVSGRAAQAIPDNRRRRQVTVVGNSLDPLSGCRGNGLRGRDGYFVAAPRMVLAAASPERGGQAAMCDGPWRGCEVRKRACQQEGRPLLRQRRPQTTGRERLPAAATGVAAAPGW